jgi:hypothetical protein
VLESDGTLLITADGSLRGESALAAIYCRKYVHPLLHINRSEPDVTGRLSAFIVKYQILVLNIAGPHASWVSGIEGFVRSILDELLQICPPSVGNAPV